MTRIDFYIVNNNGADGREQAACRIINKVFQHGHTGFILAGDAEQAQRLDRLLWTFNPGSFIPHRLDTDTGGEPVAVLIGHRQPEQPAGEVLINLSDELPSNAADYARVLEIIGPGEEEKQQGRAHYRHYKECGYELHTHEI